jgi:hypothetical protein
MSYNPAIHIHLLFFLVGRESAMSAMQMQSGRVDTAVGQTPDGDLVYARLPQKEICGWECLDSPRS